MGSLFRSFDRRSEFVKESLSEYGSGWGWETNTYAHVFDQTASDGVPYRYAKEGTGDADNMQYYICPNDIETTNGQILFSGNVYTNQTSCRAMTGNAGNWYSWPAATTGGSKSSGNEENSVCPRGWQLITNTANDINSWYYLITSVYKIGNASNDEKIRMQPLSVVRAGAYKDGNLNNRSVIGYYWTLTAAGDSRAYRLRLKSNQITQQHTGSDDNYNKNTGNSVRCVNSR